MRRLYAPLFALAAVSAHAQPAQLQAGAADRAALAHDFQIEAARPLSGEGCTGYGGATPTATVVWTPDAEADDPLSFWVRSGTDATLMVEAPLGETLCEDDTEGVQPAITIAQARAGTYRVWVGAFNPNMDTDPSATLYIGRPLAQPVLDPQARAQAGRLMFDGEAMSVDVTAGGEAAWSRTEGVPAECGGFADIAQPTAYVDHPGQGAFYMTAEAVDGGDPTLAVWSESEGWVCNDDAGSRNAAVRVGGASPRYTVWVGTFAGFPQGTAPRVQLGLTPTEPEGFGQPGPAPTPLPPPPIATTPTLRTETFSTGTYEPFDVDAPAEMALGVAASGDITMADISARGDVSNPVTGGMCNGYVPRTPTTTLDADGQGPLSIAAVTADTDLVLLVRDPNGAWYCSDDAQGLSPGMELDDAPAGLYTVWVGTYGTSSGEAATLSAARAPLSDLMPDLGQTDMMDDFGEVMEESPAFSAAAYGGQELDESSEGQTAVLTRDDLMLDVPVRSDLLMPLQGAACNGYVGREPSAWVHVEGEEPFSIVTGQGADLVMAVRSPSGQWWCSDDAVDLAPGVEVADVEDGTYRIWVGPFSQEAGVAMTNLTIRRGALPSR